MNTEQQAVPVAQEDREAAANVVASYRDQKNGNWQQRIRDGLCDDGEMVQAFARHRLARLTPIEGVAASELEAMRHKLWMVACHATGGGIPEIEGIDRSVNDICVQITATRNMIYLAGKESATPPATSPAIPEGKSGDGVGREAIARIVYGWTPHIRSFEHARSGDLADAYRHADEVIAALTPDATQTREAELVAALEGIANYPEGNWNGDKEAMRNIARAALNARGDA